MSAVRANSNTATYTDAVFAPSFCYAYNFVSDTAFVVSVFVNGVVDTLRIIKHLVLSVLIKA